MDSKRLHYCFLKEQKPINKHMISNLAGLQFFLRRFVHEDIDKQQQQIKHSSHDVFERNSNGNLVVSM